MLSIRSKEELEPIVFTKQYSYLTAPSQNLKSQHEV